MSKVFLYCLDIVSGADGGHSVGMAKICRCQAQTKKFLDNYIEK